MQGTAEILILENLLFLSHKKLMEETFDSKIYYVANKNV